MVPRLAGRATVSWCWVWPSCESDAARTPWSQVARRRRPPNVIVSAASRSLIRRLTRRFTRGLVRQLHVGRLVRGRLDEPEPLGGEALDPGGGGCTRELH